MNRIHPTAVVAGDVELGTGNVVGPYAVLLGPARLGDDNWIGPHVVIGTPAEIRGIDHGAGWDGSPAGTGVHIGSRNVFREYTTVHQGHYASTVVGADCYVMNKVYIAHDDVVGDGVTMAASVTLGGHVHVGAGANLGMGATVHQRRIVGPGAMVGMGAVVTRDLPPYALAYGSPCRVRGANSVGMSRSGVPESSVRDVAAAYAGGREIDPEAPPPGTEEAFGWWRRETRPA